MAKALPPAPHMEHFKKQAKELLASFRVQDAAALYLFKQLHPECMALSLDDIAGGGFALADAQLVVARDYAFATWPRLKSWVTESGNPLRSAWVAAILSEDIPKVKHLLGAHPSFANSSHVEFDDPRRSKKFPTATLDYVAAGPWPQTPECRAISRGRVVNWELLRLLVNHGARPDGDTHHGACLCWVRDPAVAAFLVQHGASLDRWYLNGGSPLNFTCWGADPERASMLLRLGADPNVVDPITLESCLHYAAGSGANACIRLLLEAGADPNARCVANPNLDCYLVRKMLPGTPLVGETPLHRAALIGDIDCIGTLLEHGADPTLRTVDGATPGDWAQRAGVAIAISDRLAAT